MRTSNDAENLLLHSKQNSHNVLDQMIRSRHAEAICVSDAFNALSQARALAALRPRAIMH